MELRGASKPNQMIQKKKKYFSSTKFKLRNFNGKTPFKLNSVKFNKFNSLPNNNNDI